MDLNSIFIPPDGPGAPTITMGSILTMHPSPAWELRSGTVDRLVAYFDLKRPVVVNQVDNYNFGFKPIPFFGCYTSCVDRAELLCHSISVKANVHPYVADEYLWHEFCHAAQAERLSAPTYDRRGIDLLHALYRMESVWNGYSNNQYEVEAREHQKLATVEAPLTQPTANAPTYKVPLSTLQDTARVPAELLDIYL